jgi:outer membrane protein OmpA-like peptidoglycan-associated protein
MSCRWLLVLCILLGSLKVSSQQKLLNGDYIDAIDLKTNQKYIFKTAAKGFGRKQEYPLNKARSATIFEKERNTSWFSLSIEADGFLSFDIIPISAQDDYDWMLFKETSVNATYSKIDYNKPLRTNNSRNDGTIAGKTGLKDGFTNLFTAPGPGKNYSKPVQVHQGETYILVIDNIYTGGKGFAFSSTISKTLPSLIPKPVVSGIITDKQSMQPLSAIVTVEDSSGKTVVKTVSDSLTGSYSFKIPAKSNYFISVFKKGYALYNDFLTADSSSQHYQLQKLKTGTHILFYNIRFLPNSAAIVNNSGTDLTRLLNFLTEEKDWKIQIIGHTNANVFTDEHYLQRLSEKRSWAVKTYLLQHGIANERMHCFGLGGKNPLYNNKKPEEAVKNLRVEVVLER